MNLVLYSKPDDTALRFGDDHVFRLLHRFLEGRWQTHSSRLSMEVAKRPETIKWANGWASCRVVPKLVIDEWGIDLKEGTFNGA